MTREEKEIMWNFDRLLALGFAIIEEAGREYCTAYENGDTATLNERRNWLLSGEVEILSAEQQSGKSLVEKLDYNLKLKFGSLSQREKAFKEREEAKQRLHDEIVAHSNKRYLFIDYKSNKYVTRIFDKKVLLVDEYSDKVLRNYRTYKTMKERIKELNKSSEFDIHIKEITLKKER